MEGKQLKPATEAEEPHTNWIGNNSPRAKWLCSCRPCKTIGYSKKLMAGGKASSAQGANLNTAQFAQEAERQAQVRKLGHSKKRWQPEQPAYFE